MKIYLADLAYMNPSVTRQTVPFNVGCVASYALKHMPDAEIEIFKHPDQLIDAVEKSPPDVLALSHYAWNSVLNHHIMNRCKALSPDLVIMMGGCNFNDWDGEWVKWFFHKRPALDLYIAQEGEGAFLQMIQLLAKSGGDLKQTNFSDWPSNAYGCDRSSGELIHNPSNQIGLIDPATLPSPYLTGLMGPFLASENLSPIIETNRGCPYSCSFCVWGGLGGKLRQYDLQTIIEEVRYIAQNSVNSTKVLYIADSNFGILKRDREIAETIMECRSKYGFPQRLSLYSPKNPSRHSIETSQIISPVTSMSMSLQSTNKTVLENIRRSNIKSDKYQEIRVEAEKLGIQSDCELIYGLPGESYESFLNGLVKVTRTGQFVQLYEHTVLWGAESANREYRKKHGIKSAFRYAYDIEGTYKGISSLEYEEVVIATNAMPESDYFRLRQLHFLVASLTTRAFKEFRHAMKYHALDIATLAGKIMEDEKNWPEGWSVILEDFQKACRGELITSDIEEIKMDFSESDLEDVRKRARALIPAFLCRLFARKSNMRELRDYIASSLPVFFEDLTEDDVEELSKALDISMDMACCYDGLVKIRDVEYNYDLESWLDSDDKPLKAFRLDNPRTYRINLREGIWDAFEKAKGASNSIENAVYLLKMKYFPSSHDRIFYYLRESDRAGAVMEDDEIESKRAVRLPLYSGWNSGGKEKAS